MPGHAVSNVRSHAVLLGIMAGVSLGALAEPPPPVAPAGRAATTIALAPVTGLRMGSLYVQFESTRLDEVLLAALVGAIAHRGDAAESIYWLCYTVDREAHTERVWIVADGEMGGPEHFVTGVSAEIVPTGPVPADCPALPDDLESLSLEGGLWLGASEEVMLATYSEQPEEKGEWRAWEFMGKVPGACESGGFDRVAWLRARLEGGRLRAVQAGQITSC
jgi:hypothetical protein